MSCPDARDRAPTHTACWANREQGGLLARVGSRADAGGRGPIRSVTLDTVLSAPSEC